MSDDLVKRAREALDGVTDGPWLALDYTDADEPRWHVLPPDKHGTIASLNLDREADAHFIAAARDLVPDMADRIEELEAENRLLRDAVYIDDLTVTMQANDRSKALAAIGRALGFLNADMPTEAKTALRTTLAELTGGKDE